MACFVGRVNLLSLNCLVPCVCVTDGRPPGVIEWASLAGPSVATTGTVEDCCCYYYGC